MRRFSLRNRGTSPAETLVDPEGIEPSENRYATLDAFPFGHRPTNLVAGVGIEPTVVRL